MCGMVIFEGDYVCVCIGVVTDRLLTFHNITLSLTVCVQACVCRHGSFARIGAV